MDNSDLWKLILLAVCFVLSGFFSASETAFIALPRARLLHLVSTGKSGARRVSGLAERPEKLLATVLLSNNLVNTAAAALATAVAISIMDSPGLAVLVATIGVTLILLIFAETLPKTMAWRRAETVAFAVSRPLVVVSWVLSPAVHVLQWLTQLVGRSLRIAPIHSAVTEEEIRTLISVGAQAGAVETTEAEMLEKVFHFGDRQVQEIMTPRTEIAWVEQGTSIEDFLDIYKRETHTRFPVYEDDMENIVGILSVKDLLHRMAESSVQSDDNATSEVRPAFFVPETKLVGELFSEMRQAGQQMAVVIDQFGGVAGLVTMKSLMEVIVGPVGEEGEPAREEFEAVGENIYEVDAGMAIQEVNDELELDLPEGSYQTVAGFILERLGHIPKEGERLYYKGLGIEIKEMRRYKIERVQVWWTGLPAEPKDG